MASLTALQIANPPNGKTTYGNNLVFDVRGHKSERVAGRVKVIAEGSMRWLWLGVVNGKRVEITIGKSPKLSLKEASAIALAMCNLRADGKDPRLALGQPIVPIVAKTTFKDDMNACYEREHRLWSKDHARAWKNSLVNHADSLMAKATGSITSDDVLAVIRPIWTTINPTANEILGRINAVINLALALHPDRFPLPVNPCVRARMMLPKGVRLPVANQEAMCWKAIPDFFTLLTAQTTIEAYALRFLLLNGCPRTDEVRMATWAEIDGDLWTCPASRLKNGKGTGPRTNRLTVEAMAVLDAVRPATVIPTDPIFPSRVGGHLWQNGMLHLLQSLAPRKELMAKPFTVHGFRASFTGWVKTHHRRFFEEAEILLNHKTTGALGTAYDREQFIDERHELAGWWADFLTAQPQAMAMAA